MTGRPRLDRRALLGRGLGSAAALGLAAWRTPGRPSRPEARPSLVLVQLSGGNDGLSTVVPHGDDLYHAARRATRLRAEEVLRLDERVGLHPELAGLHARFHEGGLAIVQGVGYPEPSRSHFRSFEIWHAADPRGRAAGTGWIGRLCEAAFGADVAANRIVHVGSKPPFALHSPVHPTAAFTVPAGYRWVRGEEELAELDRARPTDNAALALLRERTREARASSAAVRSAALSYRTPVDYPSGGFGEALRAVAAVLNGGIGTRVASVELGGFDTHADQRRRHDELLRTLDRGLVAFLADLERSEPGRGAIVLVHSEFGRRVAENGSRGTDHGTAGPVLVAGARVRGGLHGEHPRLDALDGGDLVHGTDFRSVYQAVLEAAFPGEVDPERVLGRRYPELRLI